MAKVAILGAGSEFTQRLVPDIISLEEPDGGTFALVDIDEKWLDLAARRGSISTIGDVDMSDYAQSQYELFHGLAQDFGYLSN